MMKHTAEPTTASRPTKKEKKTTIHLQFNVTTTSTIEKKMSRACPGFAALERLLIEIRARVRCRRNLHIAQAQYDIIFININNNNC
jgi:hypothetical protein